MFALAYYNLGYIAFHRKDYGTAQNNFQKFIQLQKGITPHCWPTPTTVSATATCTTATSTKPVNTIPVQRT